MKICDEVEEKQAPELIMGHLYQLDDTKDGDIYICAYENRLINLQDGYGWSGDQGFGSSRDQFTDVTDKYCLKRVGE